MVIVIKKNTKLPEGRVIFPLLCAVSFCFFWGKKSYSIFLKKYTDTVLKWYTKNSVPSLLQQKARHNRDISSQAVVSCFHLKIWPSSVGRDVSLHLLDKIDSSVFFHLLCSVQGMAIAERHLLCHSEKSPEWISLFKENAGSLQKLIAPVL